MNHPDHPPLWRPSAALLALLLVISPLPLRAGDLNTEVNDMFNNLGAIGNYTAPGAFRGQTFNTYTGGNLMMRSPNKVYQLAAIQFPSAKAGCGGIDVFGGSFSHISATEFKNMLKNITAALPGIAFQLALEAVSPLLGRTHQVGQGAGDLDQQCPHQLVRDRQGHRQHGRRIRRLQLAGNLRRPRRRDGPGERPGCGAPALRLRPAQHPGIGAFLHRSDREEQGPLRRQPDLEGAAVHGFLPRRSGARADHEPGRHIIYYPEESARDPEPIAPTLTSISQLLYGQSAAGGTDVIQHMLKCNDYTNCDVVTLNTGTPTRPSPPRSRR
jgi:conjugative transfer pilus assembly protein TraH